MKNQQYIKDNRPVGVSERKSPPILTLVLAVVFVLIYQSYRSAHGQSWIMRNAFQAEQIVNLFNTHKFDQLANMILMTNFTSITTWHLLLSIYFFCLFGIAVEKRLGPIRYMTILFVAGIVPWIVQFTDLTYCPIWPIAFEYPKYDFYFFGPSAILLALSAAYMVLVPKKAADMSNSRLHRKDRTEIFNKRQAKPMTEKFGLSPTVFLTVFLIYMYALHYIFGYLYKGYDTIGLYAGLSAFAVGYFIASFIHVGLEESYQEHPLKHAAIKHYYELLDLDVGHENAVKGSAKALGLPDYQVEDWVKKTKGKLRPT
jgi:membrane associated rhomboid family serine protease